MSKELLGSLEINRIYQLDCEQGIKLLPDNCIDICVTSPPYWSVRDYGVEGQIGVEIFPEEYIKKLINVFNEVRRVLKPSGTLWLNLGDVYLSNWGNGRKTTWWSSKADESERCKGWGDVKTKIPPNTTKNNKLGIKVKDLCGIPWRIAIALQESGWFLRCDIIWKKTSGRSEIRKSGRPSRTHEYIFLMSKKDKYYYNDEFDFDSNSVWQINASYFKGNHTATMPEELVKQCILAGCPEKIYLKYKYNNNWRYQI